MGTNYYLDEKCSSHIGKITCDKSRGEKIIWFKDGFIAFMKLFDTDFVYNENNEKITVYTFKKIIYSCSSEYRSDRFC